MDFTAAAAVTEHELNELKAAARSLGLPVSSYIRAVMLGRPIPRSAVINAEFRKAWGELGPLAANLNQAVRGRNSALLAGQDASPHDLAIVEACTPVLRALNEVRAALLPAK